MNTLFEMNENEETNFSIHSAAFLRPFVNQRNFNVDINLIFINGNQSFYRRQNILKNSSKVLFKDLRLYTSEKERLPRCSKKINMFPVE